MKPPIHALMAEWHTWAQHNIALGIGEKPSKSCETLRAWFLKA